MDKDFEQFEPRPHLTKEQRPPSSYRYVERVLKDVKACKGNLTTVMNNTKLHGRVFKKVYALSLEVLKYRHILDKIIKKTKLLEKEKFLRPDLAEILVYELVLGKGLKGESRPITVVRQHEDSILKAYEVEKMEGNVDVKGFQPLPRYARVNTLLTTVADVLANLRKDGYRETYYGESTSEEEYLELVKTLEPGNYMIDFHFKDLLVFDSTENLTTWSLYKKNHVHLHDKSSYIPVYALDPKPGSVVIDACAAPGMKTIHIAAKMENYGKIYAYEKNLNRFHILKNMLDRSTAQICEAECEDFYSVNANDPKFNDLECILLDPSCSGSGMVNRMDSVTDTEESKNAYRIQKLAGFQILLLKHALSFPSVKRVVYSTCSMSEEENEYVVHEVLNQFRQVFKLVSVMPNWSIRGSENFEFGKLCLRAHPEKTLTNGFFVAMFERLDYDEMLNMSKAFPKKSFKRKGKESDFKGANYDVSRHQENPQFLDDGVSFEPHNSSKKKKKHVENNINQDYSNNKDQAAQLENMKIAASFTENDLNISSNTSHIKLSKKRKQNGEIDCNDVDLPYSGKREFDFDGNSDFSADTNRSTKKKKKHKKEISDCDIYKEVDDQNNDDVEKTNYEKELNETEPEMKVKKHKHKKKHSKEKAESCDDVKHRAENSLPGDEITDLKDGTSRKKHKKKHSKKDREVADLNPDIAGDSITVYKKSFCGNEEAPVSISDVDYKKKHIKSTEILGSCDDKLSETRQDVEANCITKKHKKKCKYKRSKEE